MKDNLSRASLFNLIIYADAPHRLSYFREVVQTVIKKYPCRIILIQNQGNEQSDLFETEKTTVSSESESSGIVCDQITIKVSGPSVKKVPFQVLASLAPDLPIYLLWGQEPNKEHEILPHLQGVADHLIFDSECVDDLSSFSQVMLDKKGWHGRIIDMNWARFSGWRDVLCHAFENQERIDELKDSVEVTINYNSQPSASFKHQDTQAVYLQAWLAARLGWKYLSKTEEDSIKRYHFSQNSHELVISVEPVKVGSFAPGAITSIKTAGSAGDTTTLIRNENTPKQIAAQICSAHSCESPFSIPLYTMTRGLTFIKQILYAPSSPQYYEMLQILSQQH